MQELSTATTSAPQTNSSTPIAISANVTAEENVKLSSLPSRFDEGLKLPQTSSNEKPSKDISTSGVDKEKNSLVFKQF